MSMQIDLEGFVEGNVPLSPSPYHKCLLPLYEAVSNSLHSIQAAKKPHKARISITIHRDSGQGVLRGNDGQKFDSYPIDGFTIKDNGTGFDAANFESFNTAFTRLKRHLGAKGRGRFMWLKVFTRADIASIFFEDAKLLLREFAFTIKDGCKGGKKPTEVQNKESETTVKLSGMRSPFKDSAPRTAEAIAGHLVRRFLQFFALPKCPEMVLIDPAGGADIKLNDWFNKLKVRSETTRFQLHGRDFQLDHLLLARRGDVKHELHFCGHKQAVSVEPLEPKLPDLRAPISEGEEHVVYQGYVSGEFLDDSVNPERTDFDRVADNSLPREGFVPWNEIVDSSVGKAAKFLEPYTAGVRAAKDQRVTDYVHNEAPWYRHVVKQRPDILASISPAATPNDIDNALYQASKAIEIDLRKQASELLVAGEKPDSSDYFAKLEQFLEQFGDVGKDQLARYVAHRKAILSFLFDRLRLRADGKHFLEKDIHQVIFPMRTTSDDVEPDRTNLWIIDERLAFHYYLASDKPLKSIEPMTIESGKELDLLIFDRPFFFGEGEVDIGAAVIIEFKRPMTDDRDPIRQVFGYVRTIRTGTVTKDDRTLKVKDGTPFYAYVLCDLTPKMREYAEDAGLKVTPDDEGFIGFNATHQVYVEVISYQKAIADAQKRNAILFHKLGLPPELMKVPIQSNGTTDDSKNGDAAMATTD
jgi:hypothetical protein